MSDDLTFASLTRKSPGRKSSCAVCGNSTSGSIQVALTTRRSGKLRMLSSFSKALCERHCVEIYRRFESELADFIEGGDRPSG
jgi:hypothetical protein